MTHEKPPALGQFTCERCGYFWFAAPGWFVECARCGSAHMKWENYERNFAGKVDGG